MRRRQLHRHDSRNISCRDMVDLRLLDEASTAPLARSPACLEPELFGVLNKMLFVCGSEASSEVWSRLGPHTFCSRAMPQNKKNLYCGTCDICAQQGSSGHVDIDARNISKAQARGSNAWESREGCRAPHFDAPSRGVSPPKTCPQHNLDHTRQPLYYNVS